MARMLIQDGDECLWNVLGDILESEGYVVLQACNDYEGLPHALPRLMALPLRTIQYGVALDWGVL
jgi:hypothetical protein